MKALLIVDVQNDFCPGGKLAVAEGDKIVPVLNEYIKLFSGKGLPVLASRDWHPPETGHFKQYGGMWPEHCVRDTKGAEFHPHLHLPESAIVISKGMDPDKDSYSVFMGEDSGGRPFPDVLKDLAIRELFIGGLATDYCVRQTVLDALANNYKVLLLTDVIRGVDVAVSQQAIREMRAAGAEEITFTRASKNISPREL